MLPTMPVLGCVLSEDRVDSGSSLFDRLCSFRIHDASLDALLSSLPAWIGGSDATHLQNLALKRALLVGIELGGGG
jgi:hypothetical protein